MFFFFFSFLVAKSILYTFTDADNWTLTHVDDGSDVTCLLQHPVYWDTLTHTHIWGFCDVNGF